MYLAHFHLLQICFIICRIQFIQYSLVELAMTFEESVRLDKSEDRMFWHEVQQVTQSFFFCPCTVLIKWNFYTFWLHQCRNYSTFYTFREKHFGWILTWLKVGLLCNLEQRSPCLQAPILK